MARHTGIGRYVRQLLRAMVTARPQLDLTLWVGAGEGQPDWLEAPVRTATFDARVYTLREQIVGSRLSRQAGGICHFPHYNAPWGLPRKSVVTVHDLTHFEFPDFFPVHRRWLARLCLRHAMSRAGRVIAVSEATRAALERAFPDVAARTTVIRHGATDSFRPLSAERLEEFRGRHGTARPFLFVGSTRRHKNLETLWRAFASYRQSEARGELVCVLESPQPAPVEGVRVLSAVPDDELVGWYNAAEALILPSLNEGFGLPALEAMACGTPVVASAIPALEEVIGDAGILIGPTDAYQLTAAMSRLATERPLREELAERSLRRAAEFSWRTAAERTLAVYGQLSQGGA